MFVHYVCAWLLYCLYIFFFFKQKTAYEMRISDWSSDVCSSDLCLKVAQEEINKLCPFWVEFTPIKKGRKVERVSMMWLPKTMSGRRDAQNLIDQHSIVRRAKLRGDIPEMPVLVDFSAPAAQR